MAITGMPLANAMIPGNIYTGLSETSTDIYNQMRWRDYEFYAGDSWKVNRKLTVDLGVRYSMLRTPYQVNGLMTSFNPNLYDPNGSPFDACNGLWTVPGKKSLHRRQLNLQPDWAVRVQCGHTRAQQVSQEPKQPSVRATPGRRLRCVR